MNVPDNAMKFRFSWRWDVCNSGKCLLHTHTHTHTHTHMCILHLRI